LIKPQGPDRVISMIDVIEKILTIALLGVLLFNLTQRKHLEKGEKKRTASLLLGLVILLPLAGIFAYKQNSFNLRLLGSGFFYPLGALTLLFFLFLSRKILIFRRRCAGCRKVLPWKTTLYRDDNLCPVCQGETSEHRELVKAPLEAHEVPDAVDRIDWENWVPREEAVICYIVDEVNRKVLLMHKKTGLGEGKVNAPGGRIDPGETALEAAVRECREEVHMTPMNLEMRMELHFQFKDGYSLRGEAFFCNQWEGEPMETREADPFWCSLDEIPYAKMWEDDIHWLPRALKGEIMRGFYIFDGDVMLSQRIESLPAPL